MKFSTEEIQLARQLKAAGLPWQPTPGHYVWDGEPLIQHDSPFHDRVFFILDLKHFLRRSETLEKLIESMVWLPTWEQAREILREYGIESGAVAEHLQTTQAFQNGTERLELYQLIASALSASTT